MGFVKTNCIIKLKNNDRKEYFIKRLQRIDTLAESIYIL